MTVKNRLGRFFSKVAAMTVCSRVLGFLRDVVLAQFFGASGAFDAFAIAFKIPNFMRRLFSDGAFSHAFVPVLSEHRVQESTTQMQTFINHLTGIFGVTLLSIVIIAEILAPFIIMIIAPGLSDDPMRWALATRLMRWMLPYLFFIALVSLFAAILNTYHRFTLVAFTPMMLNIVLILVTLIVVPHVPVSQSIDVLAWGVLISGILQLAVQCVALSRLGLLPKPRLRWQDTGIKRVMKQIAPALLGVSVFQIGLLIDNIFASFLPAGSVSWLYYSDRLIDLPLGIISVALATVVMPHLSRQYQTGSMTTFSRTLDGALRIVMVIAIPAAVGLFLLAGPIIATLFHHGKFTNQAVWMTQRSLMAFAIGLPALMSIKILVSAFYARQAIQIPVKIAAGAIAVNVVGNALFISILAHAGLALSTALACWFNAMLLYYFLVRQQSYQRQPGWHQLMVGIALGTILMAVWLGWQKGHLFEWLGRDWFDNAKQLIVLMGGSVFLFVIGLLSVGLRRRHFKCSSFEDNYN